LADIDMIVQTCKKSF